MGITAVVLIVTGILLVSFIQQATHFCVAFYFPLTITAAVYWMICFHPQPASLLSALGPSVYSLKTDWMLHLVRIDCIASIIRASGPRAIQPTYK